MKAGIRTKLVAMLLVVAMLPLLAGLVTLVIEGTRLRQGMAGQNILAMADADARELGTRLTKDIEKLDTSLHAMPVISALEKLDQPLRPEELAALDKAWPSLAESSPQMSRVLTHPISDVLRLIRDGGEGFVELLVTDRLGQLVAATGRTTDFYQADEDWWQTTYDEGRGCVLVTPVEYDESSGVWSICVCLPIRTRAGQVVGVLKSVLSTTGWVRETTRNLPQGRVSAMLVRDDGRIIFGEDVEPLTATADNWRGSAKMSASTGWFVTPDDEIRAFTQVALPETLRRQPVRAPRWWLVLSTPRGEAMRIVYRLLASVLSMGLTFILALFMVGYHLVNRSVIRRLRALAGATKAVAAGDLSHRVKLPLGGRRLLGGDEIDDLADDFNRMVQQIQQSHEALQEASELKTNFIRLASHELRTPVSYIMGVVHLLASGADAERMQQALEAIGGRADRLNDIIQAMFKLLPAQRFGEQMNYGEVDVVALAEEVLRACDPFVKQRNQLLRLEKADGIPVVQADRDKLRDVIENLVMNAIKFTPDGGEVRVRVGHQLGDRVSITVTDQGPGIPAGDLPHIFQPFFSTADVMKHSSGEAGYQKRGMGLGLAVVHHFTELHGGRVHVATGPSGSTFTVTIPVEPLVRTRRPGTPGGSPA